MDGEPVTVGFNRYKGGMDVLAKLDLHVADVTMSPRGEVVRLRTEESLLKFASCVADLTQQISDQLGEK
jgi:hypothetical protein